MQVRRLGNNDVESDLASLFSMLRWMTFGEIFYKASTVREIGILQPAPHVVHRLTLPPYLSSPQTSKQIRLAKVGGSLFLKELVTAQWLSTLDGKHGSLNSVHKFVN